MCGTASKQHDVKIITQQVINSGELPMTKRIGNKDEAQHRGKQEKKDIKRTNKARELIKQAVAKAKYHNQVRNQPMEMSLPPA
jgi:antitoxin component of RelBE/YafQ-DinJ toxin-antitoxin module